MVSAMIVIGRSGPIGGAQGEVNQQPAEGRS